MTKISEGTWRSAAAIAVSVIVVWAVARIFLGPAMALFVALASFRWQSLSIGKRGGGEKL